jgi:hypothetical protein
MERRLPLPRALFQWVLAAVVASLLLGFVLGTKMFFVAGAIILLGFGFGAVQSAVRLHRERPHRNALRSVADLLPHSIVLLLAVLLLGIVVRELLRR